ncbi:MAG: LLM class flavin-dependent oxidoreductase [Anaerolineales bacterium]
MNFKAPLDTPIIVATSGRQILRLAGEISDGIMLGDLATATVIETAQGEINRGADRAGRSKADLPQISRMNLLLTDDAAAAQDRMRAWLINGMWYTYPRWSYYLNYAPDWEEHFAPFKDFLEEFGGKPRNIGDYKLVADYQHLITIDMVRDAALVGTAVDVESQINEIAGTGVDQIALYPIPLEGQTIESVLEQFVNEVQPRVHVSQQESLIGPAIQAWRHAQVLWADRTKGPPSTFSGITCECYA